ncbi:MAG: siderophore-interacting protein [Caulobacteraceae bacterium]
MSTDTLTQRHEIKRVKREPRRRTLTVEQVERLTLNMQRIVFTSPELVDFESAGADDHVKLFLPDSQGGMCMRDYTPRSFDRTQGRLTIDFALHEAGPATAWALDAKVGETLQIGGPRGSSLVTDDFDWYLLIGDETALPSIGRRLEELRADVPVITLVMVETEADAQQISTKTAWKAKWIARRGQALDDASLLRFALDELTLPSGDGYVWIGAEGRTARTLRTYMAETRGHPKAWMKASGYWAAGDPGAHVKIED